MSDENPPRMLPVSEPDLGGRERQYLLDAFDSTWISSKGVWIERFESTFAAYLDVPHAVSVFNGTVALHLALEALGIGPGDEVVVPALTYVATANAVRYTGATPVFVDVAPDDANPTPAAVEAAITPSTRGVIVAHLYGHPARMDDLVRLCEDRGIDLIEDAAEALGSEYRGRRVGGFGRVATFSFYGNKTITTGEGGMVVTRDPALDARVRALRNQGVAGPEPYFHDRIGYNYRMTNLQAAIGAAQMERVEAFVARKRELAERYRSGIDHPAIVHPNEAPGVRHSWWMCSILLREPDTARREAVRSDLGAAGIETRPWFVPLPALPPYRTSDDHELRRSFPNAFDLSSRGLNLPSGTTLTDRDVDFVAAAVLHAAGKELA